MQSSTVSCGYKERSVACGEQTGQGKARRPVPERGAKDWKMKKAREMRGVSDTHSGRRGAEGEWTKDREASEARQ
jgi:hypothetical protein